jgi:hypothetical protein
MGRAAVGNPRLINPDGGNKVRRYGGTARGMFWPKARPAQRVPIHFTPWQDVLVKQRAWSPADCEPM